MHRTEFCMHTSDNYVRQVLRVLSADLARTVIEWSDRSISASEFVGSVRAAAQLLDTHAQVLDAHSDDRSGARGTVVGLLTVTNTPATLILRYAANLIGAT